MFKKSLAVAVYLSLITPVFAEASFTDVENMIGSHQFNAARMSLEEIIHNHPNSAKAYYAMSQVQAGLGNLDSARNALDKAKSIEPNLNFASDSNIKSLEQAIRPQVTMIHPVEESHFWRNLFLLGLIGGVGYSFYRLFKRPEKVMANGGSSYGNSASTVRANPYPTSPTPSPTYAAAPAAPAYVTAPPTTPVFTSAYAPAPSVVNHYSSSNDSLLTGMMIGSMMNNNHHHDTTIIEHNTIIEHDTSFNDDISRMSRNAGIDNSIPAISHSGSGRSSSWDDSSKSSSWDNDVSSSSSSSSWGSDSSSSSSWDSGSSSSSDSSSW